MSKEDKRSFCFLSNYLYKSCKNLEAKGETIKSIDQKFSEIIDKLGVMFRPAPEIISEGEQFDVHQSLFRGDLIPKI